MAAGRHASGAEAATGSQRTRVAGGLVVAAVLIPAALDMLLYLRARADECYWDGRISAAIAAIFAGPLASGVLCASGVMVISRGRPHSRWRYLLAVVAGAAVVVASLWLAVIVADNAFPDHTCD